MGSGTGDYYAPTEALASGGSLRQGTTSPLSSPWSTTTQGGDIQGYGGDLSTLAIFALTGVPIDPQTLQEIINGLVQLGEWIAGLFQGVPNSAKTQGAGQIMASANDPISRWIGLQLVRGAQQGRVLSEGNWPQNFGGRILAMGGAMMTFANREPPANFWQGRNTPTSSVTQFSDPPRQFRALNLPPPTGAPYNTDVTIDGFFAQDILAAADYKAKFGYDIPTPVQLQQFLNDKGGIQWDNSQVQLNVLHRMIDDFLNQWIQSYQKWLSQQPVNPTPTGPDPCFGTEPIPCPPTPTTKGDQISDLISGEMTYLYFIAVALQQLSAAAQSPAEQVCCANINSSIQTVANALRDLQASLSSELGNPIDFTGLQNSILTLNGEISTFPALWNSLGTATQSGLLMITEAIKNINVNVDNSGIVDQLKAWNALNDIPDTVLQAIKATNAIPPQFVPLMQGAPWPIIEALLGAAGLLSSPTDLAKLVSGDSSDLTGPSKQVWDDVVRAFPAYFAAGKAFVNADAGSVTAFITAAFSKYLTANDKVLEPLTTGLLGALKAQLTPPPGYAPAIGALGVDPNAAVASATGIALSAAVAAWIAQGLGAANGSNLKRITELIAGAIGWEQLRDVQIGPLVRNGIGAAAEMNARKTMRQWLPSAGEILNLYARGLISQLNAEGLLPYWGVQDESFSTLEAAAYHGLQPRQLIRAFESGLFTTSDLKDELTFSGMRPASQARMLLLAPYLASNTERNEYKAALQTAFEENVIDAPTFESSLSSAEHDTNGVGLREKAAAVKAALRHIAVMEKGFTDLYTNGFTDLPTYQANLSTLGTPSTWVTLKVLEANNRMVLTQKRELQQEQRTLQRQTIAAERKTAIENYKAGNIDLPALEAALVLTGTDPVQAAAFGALAAAQLTGTQSWQYGLLLTPAAKTLLKQRVADLTDQRKREMIDGTTFIQALQQLNLPEPWQNALLAHANALITPKSDALLTNVELGQGPSQRRGTV